MRRHTLIVGIVLLGLLLLVGVAAFAQEASQPAGSGWGEIGAIVGTVLASAAASGASVLGAHRLRGGAALPDETAALLARLDERSETQGNRIEGIAKKQHRHGNALLMLLLREGHSPEEQAALAALQDDSEDDPSPPKATA